ncbi:MAG: amino acid ABC transporter permease [Rubellimicrobium sp.]|nr:amino acid ABC transporter permease [Rubellimicrobium sp.]
MTEPATGFVRTEMLDPLAPPERAGGPLVWLRANLFSSWLNAILTVISLYVVWRVLATVVPWAANGIWDATSLSNCREIRDELYGPGVPGACWAVIHDRWRQLLFGFYPKALYWRPILALAIFVVTVLPFLVPALPRRLMWMAPVAPFAIFWLLWGGSVWTPVLAMAGLAVIWGVWSSVGDRHGAFAGWVAGIVALVVIFLPVGRAFDAVLGTGETWLDALFPLAGNIGALLERALPASIQSVITREFGGFELSFIIGVAGIILSLPLGILLALGRQSHLLVVRVLSVSFIEIIRGVPLIVWLFTASLLLNYFLPPGTNFDLMLRVIIMVTIFAGAYLAEVIRGGLAALPKGQYEAADALGLDYWKSMRLIILPQALKISIPGIVNTFIAMFKDTTLVMFVGLLDPLGLSNSIRADQSWNGIYWELFLFIGALFFVVCFGMSRYSMYLEHRLARDRR